MSWPSIRPLTAGNALRASTVALTKNDMKPRPTPCFFWNGSLYFARRSMTRDMSASLKVVRIAAVCWASTSRWAIVWRIPLIRFRVSRWPLADGAARGGLGRRREPAAGGGLRGVEVGEDVPLRQPTAAAGALDPGRVDVRSRRPAGGRTARASRSPPAAGARRPVPRPAPGPAAGAGAAVGRGGGRGVERADDRADGDGRPLGDADLERAGRGGGDDGARLVGLELEERVARLDGRAVGLEPAREDALGDRLADAGHGDRDGGHRAISPCS